MKNSHKNNDGEVAAMSAACVQSASAKHHEYGGLDRMKRFLTERLLSWKKRKKQTSGRAALVTMLFLAGLLTGCGVNGTGQDAQSGVQATSSAKKLQVIATLFPYYDFARQIAGEYADVSLILPAGMDTHSFEPTAADMIRMGQADLLLYNGGENEQWVGEVLQSADNRALYADAMMDHVDTLTEETVEGMEEEKSDEHQHTESGETGDSEETAGEQDEHIWTSPANARRIVAQIATDLAKADPVHAQEYQQNARAYQKKLRQLEKRIRQIVQNAPGNYLAFADRFPLRYFVEEFGLEYTAAFSGCSSDTEPSAETITYLTDQVKARKLPVVLKIELTSDKVAKAVAEAASTPQNPVKVETFYTCHNVTREQFDAGETYLSLMEKNEAVLRDALGTSK